jgi:predicted metal-dependent enzyme (double-stranded beta helix superfamily)
MAAAPADACEGLDELVARLDAAVRLGEPHAITLHVKEALEDIIGGERLRLPERFRRARADGYTRRLLYRDPELGYVAVVMTWGPGQRTGLHDHSGIWCVEGVVEGRMQITQFDLVGEHGGVYTFAQQATVGASVGSAGCLIPPFEYHVLQNALADRTSITLHIYGGDLSQCSVFEPLGGGRYERKTRELAYED